MSVIAGQFQMKMEGTKIAAI